MHRLGSVRDPVDNDTLRARVVQQISTATRPPSTDLIRPKQTRELHQRLVSTSMQLVHTEEVIRRFVAVRLRRGSVTRRRTSRGVRETGDETWPMDGRTEALFAAVLAG